jgi:hypothetical protein
MDRAVKQRLDGSAKRSFAHGGRLPEPALNDAGGKWKGSSRPLAERGDDQKPSAQMRSVIVIGYTAGMFGEGEPAALAGRLSGDEELTRFGGIRFVVQRGRSL